MIVEKEEIQETFYNTMIDISLESNFINSSDLNDDSSIIMLITKTLIAMCNSATKIRLLDGSQSYAFMTIRGNNITRDNLEGDYLTFYDSLIMAINNSNDSVMYSNILKSLSKNITENDSFSEIIVKFKKFYIETHTVADMSVSVDSIRNTFYNLMVDQYYSNIENLKEGIEDQESYIFLCLSAYTITSILSISRKLYGIKLCNGAIVTEKNCPREYFVLFEKLLKLKKIFDVLDPSEELLTLIKNVTSANPKVEISQHLLDMKTPRVNEVISYISDLSIEISKIQHFKQIIGDVLRFCLEL
jgi:hypothetical protein